MRPQAITKARRPSTRAICVNAGDPKTALHAKKTPDIDAPFTMFSADVSLHRAIRRLRRAPAFRNSDACRLNRNVACLASMGRSIHERFY